MTHILDSFPSAVLVELTLPGAGRVLALQTRQRETTTEYIVADHDGRNTYLVDVSDDGRPPVGYQLQVHGPAGAWLALPKHAAALQALLAVQASGAAPGGGPLMLLRAVDRLAKTSCSPTEALAWAEQVCRVCAASEAGTAEAVRSIMAAA